MPNPPAPLLSPEEIAAARKIARGIRAGRVAALAGAGLSIDARMPSWNELGDRLIRAWQDWDPTPGIRRLQPSNYVKLVRHIFENNDLAFVSYLRRVLPRTSHPRKGKAPSFSILLYRALYSDPDTTDRFLYPTPSDIHRHLVALFAEHPSHLWTTNYDDLLERAAGDLGLDPYPLDLMHHQTRKGFLVTHLHGYLPPRPSDQPPREADIETPVVLAEDDYHTVASNSVDWIGHAFYRLFEEHQVLILGMSLADANLRRVLATLPLSPSGMEPGDAAHYAAFTPISAGSLPLARVHADTREQLAMEATKVRANFWSDYRLEIVNLATYARLLPFLVRLRYESHGATPGDLWQQGATHGYAKIRPWSETQQDFARQALRQVIVHLCRQFDVPADEIIDIGIFLVQPERLALELAFRVGRSSAPVPDGRIFSIDPDRPTGVAGCVFTTGTGMMMSRDHVLYDFGAPSSPATASTPYEGIITAPMVDWGAGGVPLGVIYTTVASTTGRLFNSPETEIIAWLAQAGQTVLDALRGKAN